MTLPPPGRDDLVRGVPLKVAGVIGLLMSMIYSALLIGLSEGVGLGFVWLGLMLTASALAWFAEDLGGRRPAVVATVIFFVLGILSDFGIAIVFLAAAILSFLGFAPARLRRPEGGE